MKFFYFLRDADTAEHEMSGQPQHFGKELEERQAGFQRSAPLLERTAMGDRISAINAVAFGFPLSDKAK